MKWKLRLIGAIGVFGGLAAMIAAGGAAYAGVSVILAVFGFAIFSGGVMVILAAEDD